MLATRRMPCCAELGRQGAGVGELVAVPGEHVAPRAAGRVAGAEVERRDRHALRGTAVDECGQLRLRVGRVGQPHRGLRVAQRPARRQVRAADQAHEARDHLGRRRAGDEVVVEVAVVDLHVAVETVVVVVLAAEVERARGQRVVVDAVPAAAGGAGQHERPVLVQRVAVRGVVAQRVERQRAQPPAVQVERPGLVAEPVVTLAAVAGEVVADRAGALAAEVRRRGTVGGERAAGGVGPGEGQRLRRRSSIRSAVGGHADAVVVALDRDRRAGEPAARRRAPGLPRARRRSGRSPRCAARGSRRRDAR